MPKSKKKKKRISLEESAAIVQRVIDKIKYFPPEETRGVKKGSKRGPYNPRKTGVILDKNFITKTCKQCKREFTYKRTGKRFRDFCSDKCKQKHYRITKKLKQIEEQKKLLYE